MKSVALLYSKILMTCMLSAILCKTYAQEEASWKFKTQGIITSSPVLDQNQLFFGSDDKTLYCIDAIDGTENWKFTSPVSIRSNPLIMDTLVYITSGNIVYALNRNSGTEIWNYDPQNTINASNIDPWDYHRSSLVLHENRVYYGAGDGNMYGINKLSGLKEFEFASDNNTVIRSTAYLEDSMIYFGDWKGKMYAVNTNTDELIWKSETVESILYTGFGAIVSHIVVDKDKIYFGSRNAGVVALDKTSGEILWSYNDPIGSWIPGTPVIMDTLLLIGGSDNQVLLALDIETGKLEWTADIGQNIFAKPLLTANQIVVTSGYSGTGDNPNPSTKGILHLIDKNSGVVRNRFMAADNIFSSACMGNGMIYFGCNDSNLYAVDSTQFFRPLPLIVYESSLLDLGEIESVTTAYMDISNEGENNDTLQVRFDLRGAAEPEAATVNPSEFVLAPDETLELAIEIDPQYFSSKTHYENLVITSKQLNWASMIRRVKFKVDNVSSVSETNHDRIKIYTDIGGNVLHIEKINEVSVLRIVDLNGGLISQVELSDFYSNLDISHLNTGIYICNLMGQNTFSSHKIFFP